MRSSNAGELVLERIVRSIKCVFYGKHDAVFGQPPNGWDDRSARRRFLTFLRVSFARPVIPTVDMADRSQEEKTSPQLVIEYHELKLISQRKNVEIMTWRVAGST